MTFGDRIHEIRINNQNYSLRTFYKELEKNGTKLDISQYSKIERGIQNPRDHDEFMIIIKTLGITDSQIIKELELLAMARVVKHDEDPFAYMPAFPHLKTEDELIKLSEFLKDSDKPDW